MKFLLGLALGAFLAVLLLMPQVWKKEPEYEDYREDDDGIQPADPLTWAYLEWDPRRASRWS